MYDIRHRPDFQQLLWLLLKKLVLPCSGPLLYSEQGDSGVMPLLGLTEIHCLVSLGFFY